MSRLKATQQSVFDHDFATVQKYRSKMVLSMDRWKGKVAIVTGASVGIGEAIAEHLVKCGLKVVGVARRVNLVEENSKKLAEKCEGSLHAFQADFSNEEDIKRTFEWISKNLGPVHILVNNAGIMVEGNLYDGKTEDWKKIMDLNVLGLSIATREAIKIMQANNINGHIIHINSGGGHSVNNFPGLNIYYASKFAVTALTETLRQELARIGSRIRVTSLSPGLTATEMTTFCETNSSERTESLEVLPILKPEDIADGAVYVLSTPEHVQVHELFIKPVGEPM